MRGQMCLNGIGDLFKRLEGVIMGDMVTSILPHMFLRIQVGRSRREIHHLQTRMGRERLAYDLTEMPRSAIPDRNVSRGTGHLGQII